MNWVYDRLPPLSYQLVFVTTTYQLLIDADMFLDYVLVSLRSQFSSMRRKSAYFAYITYRRVINHVSSRYPYREGLCTDVRLHLVRRTTNNWHGRLAGSRLCCNLPKYESTHHFTRTVFVECSWSNTQTVKILCWSIWGLFCPHCQILALVIILCYSELPLQDTYLCVYVQQAVCMP